VHLISSRPGLRAKKRPVVGWNPVRLVAGHWMLDVQEYIWHTVQGSRYKEKKPIA
jgi:hypothetical protein